MALWVNPNVFLFGVFGVLSRPFMDKPWFLNVWRGGGGVHRQRNLNLSYCSFLEVYLVSLIAVHFIQVIYICFVQFQYVDAF